MKNEYEIRGDVTVIFVRTPKGDVIETLISTKRLDDAKELSSSWNAVWSDRTNSFYIRGHFNSHSRYGRNNVQLHRHLLHVADGMEVDHRNRNTLDNTDDNLRVATRSNNQQNKRVQSNNTTGFKGVVKSHSGKYQARGNVDKKRYILGYYDTVEEANIVAQQFRLRHTPFSEDDKVNPILPEYDFMNDLSTINKEFKTGSSQYYGVSRDSDNCWAVKYSVNGETKFGGNYGKEIDAAYAHDTYTRLYGTGNAHINFPDVYLTIEELESRKYNRGGTSSKYIGVTKKPNGKWGAQYYDGDRTRSIGTFDNETTASIARDIALFKRFGSECKYKFNHADLFNADTITWDSLTLDSGSPITHIPTHITSTIADYGIM